MTKREIIEAMIAEGYHMMNRTIEEFEQMFTLEQLQYSYKCFMKWKGKAE